MRRKRRKATAPLAAEVLEHRALLTTFVGTTEGTFENPNAGAFSGEGTSTFNWGESFEGSEVNQFDFESNAVDVRHGTAFSLGTLTYYNGITQLGGDTTQVDLAISLTLTSPDLGEAPVLEHELNMSATPNTEDPDESADTVVLGSDSAVHITVRGKTYAFRVLGFGSLEEGEFNQIEKFVVHEEDTVSADLIAEFTPLADLTATRLATPKISRVGDDTRYRVTIANRGIAHAEDFNVHLVLSTDAKFNGNDVVIKDLGEVTQLKRGQRMTMRGTFMIPADVHQRYSGEVYIGVIVDPNDSVTESNEDNNLQPKMRRNITETTLHDPSASREVWTDSNNEPLVFNSKKEVYAFLQNQGYEKLRSDRAGSRSIAMGARYSRRTGELMEPGAFRIEAYPKKTSDGDWTIEMQIGEPNRAAALKWGQFARYLKVWHAKS